MVQMFGHEGEDEPRINLNGQPVQKLDRKAQRAMNAYKGRVHELLKERLDLHSFEISDYRNPKVIKQGATKLKEVLTSTAHEIPSPYTRDDAFKQIKTVMGVTNMQELVQIFLTREQTCK